MTQAMLSEVTGINRSMIGIIENEDYLPYLDQLEILADVLNFELEELFETETPVNTKHSLTKPYHIAVAGTGYVGLSIAALLAQHNHVTAVDILLENEEKS